MFTFTGVIFNLTRPLTGSFLRSSMFGFPAPFKVFLKHEGSGELFSPKIQFVASFRGESCLFIVTKVVSEGAKYPGAIVLVSVPYGTVGPLEDPRIVVFPDELDRVSLQYPNELWQFEKALRHLKEHPVQ